MAYAGLIDRYRSELPLGDLAPITLNEGNTPLVPLKNLPKKLGLNVSWFVKFEGLNPTASFKDRGMTAAVTEAFHNGIQTIICASTGNTSASASAYAARANMKSVVLIPEGKIAMGKLAQAIAHGAHIIQIAGNFDDAMEMVKEIGQTHPIGVVNSINPMRLAGQQTIAFEIIDALGCAPDIHALPVGNAGNISATFMGYEARGMLPILLGYQAAGAAPLVHNVPMDRPETIATAIRIGKPQSWDKAVNAVKKTQGAFKAITDDDILKAQYLLASTEGIFAEPASAISIAGIIADHESGLLPKADVIVSTLTGHGLKDAQIVDHFPQRMVKIPAKMDKLVEALL